MNNVPLLFWVSWPKYKSCTFGQLGRPPTFICAVLLVSGIVVGCELLSVRGAFCLKTSVFKAGLGTFAQRTHKHFPRWLGVSPVFTRLDGSSSAWFCVDFRGTGFHSGQAFLVFLLTSSWSHICSETRASIPKALRKQSVSTREHLGSSKRL